MAFKKKPLYKLIKYKSRVHHRRPATKEKNLQKSVKVEVKLKMLKRQNLKWVHTVSFDWFLSSWSELLLSNLEFCLLKVLIYFTRNYYRKSDLGLTFPHFEFWSLYLDMFDQNWSLTKNEDFDQKYLSTGSKTQNVEELSLDLIFYNNFW